MSCLLISNNSFGRVQSDLLQQMRNLTNVYLALHNTLEKEVATVDFGHKRLYISEARC